MSADVLAKLLAKRAAAYGSNGELERARLDLRVALAQEGLPTALRTEIATLLANVDGELKLKLLKNNAFKFSQQKDWVKCASNLTKAIQLVSNANQAQDQQIDVLALGSLMADRAAASLAQGLCARCVEDCERTLAMLDLVTPEQLSQANIIRKVCLIRRGTARAWVGHLADARGDFKTAIDLEQDEQEQERLRNDLNMLGQVSRQVS